MKQFRFILSILGIIGVAFHFSTVYGRDRFEISAAPQIQQVSMVMPQTTAQAPRFQSPESSVSQQSLPQQYAAIPDHPVSGYSSGESLDDLTREIEDLKRELAKKSDKPDPNKGFTAPTIGGRVFMDSVNIRNQDADGLANYHGKNSWGFREARLIAVGEGYGFLDYKFELGFENENGANFKDMFFGIKSIPLLGYVRVGNYDVEDAGSETCNGTMNYTFMEAPAPAGDHFTSRRPGISSRHHFAGDRGRLFLGAYGVRSIAETHQWQDSNQGILLNARLTYAPVFQQEGKRMFLYGGYYSFTDPSGGETPRYIRVRPGGWNLEITSPFDNVNPDNVHKAGFETVYQNGSFCLQTDFFLRYFSEATSIHGTGDATLYGGFVMGRYFLTRGDYRKYALERAHWSFVNVHRPFLLFQRGGRNFMRGPGAWEVATYYGFLNNEEFKGITRYGTDHEIGIALNWYWNPQLRWALNSVCRRSHLTAYDGTTTNKPNMDIVGLSCRFHW